MNKPDIIDINVTELRETTPKLNVISNTDAGVINLNTSTNDNNVDLSSRKSVNFGPGADLFINKKVQSKNINISNSDINLSELKHLEPIRDTTKTIPTASGVQVPVPNPVPGSGPSSMPEAINLGKASVNKQNNSTRDGFKIFNEIPVNPMENVPDKPKMSNETLLRLKFSFIRKLDALDKQGVTVSKKYTMNDKLEEMQGEYEMIKNDMTKRNSVKFQGKMLMAFISAIEFLNSKFDPLDINLDGWSETITENIDEYDDVFSELHEKYGSKHKIAPELKLLFMLGGSATMLHMTNTMFKSSMPGMEDILKQNPDLMNQFTNAAANSMNSQNPGFSNFRQGMRPPNSQGVQMPGGHPSNLLPPNGSTPGPSVRNNVPGMPRNRPDINMARQPPRRDMNGPSDIDDILSGIKPKTKRVNLTPNKDTISVSELNVLSDVTNIPTKSKRKPRSERNTLNLNIP
jgi:hypothetical protein